MHTPVQSGLQSLDIESGQVPFNMVKIFILPIVLSMCILRDAILRPFQMSSAGT